MSPRGSLRIALFGVTGQLGQELLEKLDEARWPIAELVGVASPDSAGAEFEFGGEALDVASEWPSLKGFDLVFICTPPGQALEVVREALRASVPCIDCSGALARQPDVPLGLEIEATETGEPAPGPPLVAVPSSTTLAWARVLAPLVEAVGLRRVRGTIVSSAAAHGRGGVLALSQESIALFNQSESPEPGPAGQAVAFDVFPGGGIDADRVRGELGRQFGETLGIDVASVQVPTFVGEGCWLSVELEQPLEAAAFEALLRGQAGLERVQEGPGSRGLVAVEDAEAATGPVGPTLRDSAGVEPVLVGRIEPDRSLEAGHGWRIWVVVDPLQAVSERAFRIAAGRLGLA